MLASHPFAHTLRETPVNIAHRLARRTPFFYGWVVLGSASTAQIVRNAAASLTIAVFMFPLAEDLGWSRALIAGAASFGGLVAVFASPVCGWLIDKYGARLVLASSVFILGLSTISLAWSDLLTISIPAIDIPLPWTTISIAAIALPVVFYLAYGLGRVIFSSPVQIGASVVVSRWFIRMRGRSSGALFMSHSVGMVTFPLIASVVMWRTGSWQTAWIVLGIVVWAVALLPTSLLIVQRPEDVGLRPDGDTDEGDGPAGEWASSGNEVEPEWTLRDAMKTPALWILAIGTGALFLMQAGVNTNLAAYLQDEGLNVALAGMGIAINAIALGLGSIMWGWIVERAPARHVMTAVALTMTLGAFLFTTSAMIPKEMLTYALFFFSALFGIGLGGMLSVPPVAYADYYGRTSLGVIRGVTEPFTSGGQAIGAVAMGAVFDVAGSYYIAFIAFTIVGAVAALLVQLARPPRSG